MKTLTERNIELADAQSINMFRNMTAAEKLRAVSDMHDSACRWVGNAVRHRHPDWTEAQVHQETGRRLRGEISRNR